jgi:hypothetical protein
MTHYLLYVKYHHNGLHLCPQTSTEQVLRWQNK